MTEIEMPTRKKDDNESYKNFVFAEVTYAIVFIDFRNSNSRLKNARAFFGVVGSFLVDYLLMNGVDDVAVELEERGKINLVCCGVP